MPTFTNRAIGDGLNLPSATNQPRLISAVVNFADTASFPTGLAAADVVRVLAIPQNSIITSAGVEVLTVGTGTGTIALADTLGSANVFVAAAAPTAAGQMTRASITNNLSIYPSGTQRYLTLTGATATRTDGIVRVWALVTSLNTRDATPDRYAV
jgi:hypothetical protein